MTYQQKIHVDSCSVVGSRGHAAGACATTQLVTQGSMPHAPSPVLANYTNNSVPHALTVDEIRWFVEEYAFSAGEAQKAGLDGVELHANHEDLLHLFISPITNRRDDDYGGDRDRRLRFITEILAAIRAVTAGDFTVGIRMNMDEPPHYEPAQWSELAGRFRAALGVPVVYTGRVNSPRVAEQVLAVVIAMEDHMQPLTIAGFLTDQGKEVQLIYQTPGIAPIVGKYSIGAPLAKISAAAATVRFSAVGAISRSRMSSEFAIGRSLPQKKRSLRVRASVGRARCHDARAP